MISSQRLPLATGFIEDPSPLASQKEWVAFLGSLKDWPDSEQKRALERTAQINAQTPPEKRKLAEVPRFGKNPSKKTA